MLTHALRCLEGLSSVDCIHLIFNEIFDKQNAITMYIWSVLFQRNLFEVVLNHMLSDWKLP